MSRHRLEPQRRSRGGARRKTRPRYRRIAIAGAALVVTGVTLMAGIGVIPLEQGKPPAYAGATAHLDKPPASVPTPTSTPSRAPASQPSTTADPDAVPADSGTGRRVVFDMSDQRVWLVGDHDRVRSTYLVSGSLTDNLKPGTYAVYSRSRWAVGIDDSGTMEYFVRFTRGENAAIGFHSIPKKDGEPLQTRAQLGTPQSHGCIRQAYPDAKRMWDFAQDGTAVVVTA